MHGEAILRDVESNAEFHFQIDQLKKLILDEVFTLGTEDDLPALLTELDNQPSPELEQSMNEQRKRLLYVEGAVQANISYGSLEKLASYLEIKSLEIGDRKPPSPITLYRWIKAYVDSNYEDSSLMPAFLKSGNRNAKVPVEHDLLIKKVLGTFDTNIKAPTAYKRYLKQLKELNIEREKSGQSQYKPISLESMRKRLKARSNGELSRS